LFGGNKMTNKNLILVFRNFIIGGCVSIFLLFIMASNCQSQCLTHDNVNYPQWQVGLPGDPTIIYYNYDANIISEPAEYNQIEAAINIWNSSNMFQNCSNVKFIRDTAEVGNAPLLFVNDTSIEAAAQFMPNSVVKIGDTLFSIEVHFNPSFLVSTNPDKLYFNPAWNPNNQTPTPYSSAFTKTALHEIGHTMGMAHYLDHAAICLDEIAGSSVMNRGCGVNDYYNTQATSIQQCDLNQLNAIYLCPTPTPPPPGTVAGTGGVCSYPIDNFTHTTCPYGYTSDTTNYYCCRTGCTIPPSNPTCTEQREECENNEGLWHGCCVGCASPIVVDVLGNGFNLTNGNNGVDFDLLGEGTKERLSWTAPNSDDAWLVLDRNHNGTIDNFMELFGNYTEQPTSIPVKDRNGFLALAVFDQPANGGNNDGKINRLDRIFNDLRLWQDTNHNGISEPPELHTLNSLDVKAIFLDFKESKRADQYNNRFKYRSRVRDSRDADVGKWAWDVFLVKPR
jgi:hypothetical protein